MNIAGNSSTEEMARRIHSALEREGTATLKAIGPKALEKAVQSVERLEEWKREIYPVELTRFKTTVDGQEKTVHRMVVYR